MSSLIRSLIRETLLMEEVYGAQAIVYHGTRSDPRKLIAALLYKAKIEPGETKPSQEELDKEFQPGIGAGAMYGKGLYAVYDLKRLERNIYIDTQTAAGEYGPRIIKLKVNLYGYIIFDPFVASTVYKKPLSVVEQAEMLGLDKELIERLKEVKTEGRKNSSDAALEASKFLKGRVRGLVYTGAHDGRCILAYDATTATPVAWKAVKDESWTPVDRNSLKTYFRRRASEDWQEEKYEMTVKRKFKKLFRLPIEERIWKGDLNLANSKITSLPQGLKVGGYLYLRNSKITSLPAGLEVGGNLILHDSNVTSLSVGLKVGGDLILNDSNVTSLPAGLKVGGDLFLGYSKVTALPAGLEVGGDLRLTDSSVTTLPADLKVGGRIWFTNSKVTSLPAGLEVGGTLNLINSKVTSLSTGLKVGGTLYLDYSEITSLPAGLKVGGTLYLANSAITSLPQGLEVGDSLYLADSKVTSLPQDLKVGGNLYLANSAITSLPQGLEVGGSLYLNYSKVTSLPDGLKVGGDLVLFNSNVTTLPADLQVSGLIRGFRFSGRELSTQEHLRGKLI